MIMLRLTTQSLLNKTSAFKFAQFRNMSFEEVKFPVPWGHISGKWWGDKKIVPALAIHEFRQNAAAFDNLIPKLNLPSVLAIDLPGHGTSSHFPKGRYLHHVDFLIALRYLTRQLPSGKFCFLGHGFGSYLAFLFNASYFKLEDITISVECSRHAFSQLNISNSNWMGEISDRFFEIESTELKDLTKEQICEFYKSTSGQMSDEAACLLSERGSYIKDGKRYLTIDPRYEMHIMLSFNDDDLNTVLNNVRSKVQIIRNIVEDELTELDAKQAAQSGFFDKNSHELIRRRGPEEIRKLHTASLIPLRESSRFLLTQEVRALNHILIDNADLTATLINKFLETDFEAHQIFRAQ